MEAHVRAVLKLEVESYCYVIRRNKNIMPLLGIIRNVSTQNLMSGVPYHAQLTDIFIKTWCQSNIQLYLK